MNNTVDIKNLTQTLLQSMGIDEHEQQQRIEFIDLTTKDCELLKQLSLVIEPHADDIVDAFYKNISKYPELLKIISDAGSTIEKLKMSQRAYILEIFCGNYDSEYFERRLQIGVVHHRIGLTPRWYLGSYAQYMKLLVPIILRHWWWRPAKALQAIQALGKIISLDSQLAIDTYIDGLVKDRYIANLSHQELQRRIGEYLVLIADVTQGNLRYRVDIEGNDDLAQLGNALNNMVDSLSSMTNSVTESSNTMLETAREVKSAVTALSSGASQQASAVNETTTTLEEINATAQQNLDKATSLYEVTKLAKSEGKDGLLAVETAIEAMHDIHGNMEDITTHITDLNEHLKQIEEITNTVDDLAQQSRMLALNASIESAKAGEAGRGFSVVADEVKELAEQSRQAAAQVKTILTVVNSASVRTVQAVTLGNAGADKGAELIERAGSVLQGLNKVINDSALSSQQIVAAIRQETAGIEQIRVAMQEINIITGQFVQATKQTDDAALKFTNNAARLQDMVGHFTIESPDFDFKLARAVHRTWVVRMDSFLSGEESLSEQEAVSHHQCELGKWYDTQGMMLYGHIPQMLELGRVHQQLHDLIKQVVHKSENGVKIDKEHIMINVRSLSDKIISHLRAIQKIAESQNKSASEE
ncbi:MAG: protoglobin domain-containing protein [Pseudomonadota bacterium]